MTSPTLETTYGVNGIKFDIYYLNDQFHREDGPAYTCYYRKGIAYVEKYYLNGNRHREDGPAIIYYDTDGNAFEEQYWLNDKELNKQEWFNQLSVEYKLKIAFGVNND